MAAFPGICADSSKITERKRKTCCVSFHDSKPSGLYTVLLLVLQERKKIIPKNLTLEPLALAVWLMDDGGKSRRACYLNTQQFSLEDQTFLRSLLLRTFGIESKPNRDKQYFRLRVTTEGTKRLAKITRPYVLSCLRYKLTDDPVTTDPKGKADS